MKKLTIYIYFIAALNFSCQSSKEPDLPIIMIDTFGQEIPDEPKISAQMAITYNGSENVTEYSDSSYYYRGDIGIEIRGHTSQGFPKKQYGLETRNADGDNLSVSLFGIPEEKDWILYAPYSDKSLMRNVIAYDIYRSLGYYAPRTKFCQVILNGDYIGVYIFMEKIKRAPGRVNISNPGPKDLSGGYLLESDGLNRVDSTDLYFFTEKKQQLYTIKFPKNKHITTDQIDWIKNYLDDFERTLFSDSFNDPNTGYYQYIDSPSWIDYILINEAFRNIDAFQSSTYFYKKKDGKLFAGPVWDFNIAMGNTNYDNSNFTEGWLMDERYLPSRLLQDSVFTNEYKKRWKVLRKNQLAVSKITSMIDDYARLLDTAQKTNFIRWPILGEYVWPNRYMGNSYEDEINYLKQWLKVRFSWIDSQFIGAAYSGELNITGHVSELYNSGTHKRFGSLISGEKDGHWIEWYENGQKKNEGAYNDSKKIDKWIYYNEDGSVKRTKEY